jgi:hypothetical protein
MARRACLAIGVSTVTPPKGKAMRFGYLEGAVIAARTIGQWALSSGFAEENVRIVTDAPVRGKADPVTRERVQQAVDELFPPGAEVVEQLVLAFCGHGLTDANIGSISWLFSDSMRWKYRVLANAFYEELLLHGVQRITLITDACREAPKDLDLMRFDAVRGIAVDGARVDSPKFDSLAACQDGQLGYMVSDPTSAAPGKCVFSGVIADALCGMEPTAISNGVITTSTLGACVRSRTTERAKEYRLKLNPQCLVDPEAAVLYDLARPLQAPPELQPWPASGTAAVMGAVPPSLESLELDIERIRAEAEQRLSRSFKDQSEDSGDLFLELIRGSRPIVKKLAKRRARTVLDRLEANAGADARKRAATGVHRSLTQLKPASGPGGSNLIVSGSGAKIWSRGAVEPGRRTSARIGFRVAADPPGSPVLVELADGGFTPVVLYRGLYVLVKRSVAGDIFQAYGEHGARASFQRALKAIADFAAGRLGADSIAGLAALLRENKHTDPGLGAICAYLYRAIADYDNIRRMAFFYVQHGQPVPFDIALLGAMPVTRDADGALVLRVPAVAARERRPDEAPLPDYATNATPAVTAAIGGRCPWLALGWDYVGMARPDAAALVEGLADIAREVPRRGFTLLPGKSGRALARLWALEPHPANRR